MPFSIQEIQGFEHKFCAWSRTYLFQWQKNIVEFKSCMIDSTSRIFLTLISSKLLGCIIEKYSLRYSLHGGSERDPNIHTWATKGWTKATAPRGDYKKMLPLALFTLQQAHFSISEWNCYLSGKEAHTFCAPSYIFAIN